MGDRAYFPFESATTRLDVASVAVGAVMSVVAKAVDVAAGTGGITSGLLGILTSRTHSILLSNNPFYNREELSIVGKLDVMARKKPILIIADNLHWWDRKSLLLLNKIVGVKTATTTSKKSIGIRIIGIFTPTPFQHPISYEAFEDIRTSLFQEELKLAGVSQSNIQDCLKFFGINRKLNSSQMLKIWETCQSNVVLIKMLSAALARGGAKKIETILNDLTPDIIYYRVVKNAPGGAEFMDVLSSASVLGNNFGIDEVACVSETPKDIIAKALQWSKSLGFIKRIDNQYFFTHDTFKQYFFNKAENDFSYLYDKLLICYKKYRPGDYALRAFCAKKAGNLNEMCFLYFCAIIKEIRLGASYDSILSLSINGNTSVKVNQCLAEADLLALVYRIDECYQLIRKNNFSTALRNVPSFPKNISLAVSLELEYITALCLLSTRSDIDRKSAIELLRNTNYMLEYEPEIVLRLKVLELYAESLEQNGKPEVIFRDIENFAINNMEVMPEIWEEYHVLLRLAPAYYDRMIAIRKIREAVDYFAPRNSSPPKRIDEYYKSLNNLGSNLVATGEFGEANDVLKRATDLRDKYPGFRFPQEYYVDNNLLICAAYDRKIDKFQALRKFIDILDRGEFDDIYVCNVISLATYCGKFDLAKSLLSKLDHYLKRNNSNEVFIIYLYEMAKICLDFHSKKNKDCIRQWRELSDLAGKIPYKSGYFFETRHNLIEMAFTRVEAGNLEAWQVYLRNDKVIEDSHLDFYYRNGFFMTVIEYWRHS